jgi:cell division septum initiation protein DivIVA
VVIVVTSELLVPSARPNEIAGHRFRLSKRGFEPGEVLEYLRGVAEQMSRLDQELQWQRARNDLLEQQSESAREAAYARVSRHLTDVVRAADAAAAQLRTDAHHDARALMAAALEKARRITAAAEQEAEYIRSLAREEAAGVKAEAVAAARDIEERARSAAAGTIEVEAPGPVDGSDGLVELPELNTQVELPEFPIAEESNPDA